MLGITELYLRANVNLVCRSVTPEEMCLRRERSQKCEVVRRKSRFSNPGTPCFTVLCFLGTHRRYIFLQTESKTLHQQEDSDLLYRNTHFITVA